MSCLVAFSSEKTHLAAMVSRYSNCGTAVARPIHLRFGLGDMFQSPIQAQNISQFVDESEKKIGSQAAAPAAKP
jgi:hypothetical protein